MDCVHSHFWIACTRMDMPVFKSDVYMSVCEMNLKDQISCEQIHRQYSTHCLLYCAAPSYSTSSTYRSGQHNLALYILPLRQKRKKKKTRRVLLSPVVKISYSSHAPEHMVVLVPSHRKWGSPITRRTYEKGRLFHPCRWQSSRSTRPHADGDRIYTRILLFYDVKSNSRTRVDILLV